MKNSSSSVSCKIFNGKSQETEVELNETSRIYLSPRVGEKEDRNLLYSDHSELFYNFIFFFFFYLYFPWQLNIYQTFIAVDQPACLVALSFKICCDSYPTKE